MNDFETQNAASFEGLHEMFEPVKPYEGEIRPPETLLDSMVMDAILVFGNDNVPAAPDLYVPDFQRPAKLGSGDVMIDSYHRYRFGENFMTHDFDISETVKMKLVYNKNRDASLIAPPIIIDRLKPTGGIDTRLQFNNSTNRPNEIIKYRFGESVWLDEFLRLCPSTPDFYRALKVNERTMLEELLYDPHLDRALGIVEKMMSVNSSEARLTAKNKAEHDERMRSHAEAQESIVRARRAPSPDIIIG